MATNRHRSYGSQVAFIDLLFNTLVGFVFLFILAFILINPIAKKSNVEIVAEFIVKINWPSDSPDDIDLWMRDPLGNYVGFKSKDVGLMALSRDDLGTSNDTVYDPKGKPIIVYRNEEMVTIRGIVPGEYIVNVHFYNEKIAVDKNKEKNYNPMPVQVEVQKINPYNVVFAKEVFLDRKGHEITVVRFTINEDGSVSNFNNLSYGIVGRVVDANSGSWSPGGL
jgi:hypothetical protein|tara:strand:+ start:1657 stop:2325 length:669 start_codon:yes stop_codon:yes gene_type:complete